MKVDRVFSEDSFLAEVAELRVADAAGAVAVKHRVAADAPGSGGLDDDVAREVGDFAAVVAGAEVRARVKALRERLIPPRRPLSTIR